VGPYALQIPHSGGRYAPTEPPKRRGGGGAAAAAAAFTSKVVTDLFL